MRKLDTEQMHALGKELANGVGRWYVKAFVFGITLSEITAENYASSLVDNKVDYRQFFELPF